MLNTMKILIQQNLILKMVIVLKFQNTKSFLLNDSLKIDQEKFLLLAKLRIQLLIIAGKIAGNFYQKELQKSSQEKFRIEKLIKRKGDKLYIK